MKYLVTGGTGFIGRSLVAALLKAGHYVRVYDNDSRGNNAKLGDALKNPNLEFILGDIRNENKVAEACCDMDSVLHLSYINGTEFFYQKPDLVLDVGVRGMLSVIAGCQKAGVRELMTMSSSEVYQMPPRIPTDEAVPLVIPDVQNPRYSYGGGKIISELLTLNFGRHHFDRVLIVRPHNVYGPDMGFEHVIPQLALNLIKLMSLDENKLAHSLGKKINMPIQGDGSQTRAFIYIDDFTKGLLNVLTQGEHMQIYHIGTMDEITISELTYKIAAALGIDINLQSREMPTGSVMRRCPDIKKIKALGFSPSISIEEGVQRTVRWYHQHYLNAKETV